MFACCKKDVDAQRGKHDHPRKSRGMWDRGSAAQFQTIYVSIRRGDNSMTKAQKKRMGLEPEL